MGDMEQAQPPPRGPWARVGLWMVLGAGVGAGAFVWTNRTALKAAYRANLPQARAVGREIGATALDLAKDYLPAEEAADDLPRQPRADTLAAPRDPALRRRAPAPPRSAAGRRRLREVQGGMGAAAAVQDVRQRIDAPRLLDEFRVPFWETDLGRGIKYSLCFAFFFGFLGYALFRNTSRHARNF